MSRADSTAASLAVEKAVKTVDSTVVYWVALTVESMAVCLVEQMAEQTVVRKAVDWVV